MLTCIDALPPTSPRLEQKVRELEAVVLASPQVEIVTRHVLHAGVYSRTICIPAGVVLTGALIKIPTALIISGKVSVVAGDGEELLIEGYRVLAAAAGRKSAYIAHEDTYLTMLFATRARSVAEAEAEFTDEHEALMSRSGANVIEKEGA